MLLRRIIAVMALAALAASPLAGCGKKGNLELPPPPHQKQKESSGN